MTELEQARQQLIRAEVADPPSSEELENAILKLRTRKAEWYEIATTSRNTWRAIGTWNLNTTSTYKHHITRLLYHIMMPAKGPSAEKETLRRGTNASKRG